MGVFQPDNKDLAFEAVLQAHPLYRSACDRIGPWLTRFRAATTPADYYNLHRELLSWFHAVQQFEGNCRAQEQDRAAAMRTAVTRDAPRDARKALSVEIENLKTARQVGAAVRAVCRDLGDALVWRLLGYRRPVIAALGGGQVVGRLSDEGLETELEEIQWLWRARRVFAVHADITSCVRHGDVLAFESFSPLVLYSTESKRSGRAPTGAQARRQQQLQELVRDGHHPHAADGGPLAHVRPGVRLVSHHAALQRLVDTARSTTYAAGQISPELAVEVWDEQNPAGLLGEGDRNRSAEMRSRLGWSGDREVIVVSASLRRLRNRRLDHNFASLAPLALTPLDVTATTDLLTGRLDVISTLHVPSLEARFAAAGIEAAVARGAAAADSFLRATRGVATVTVPATVREQLQLELMTAETLVELVDWALDGAAAGAFGGAALDFQLEDEARVWEGGPSARPAASSATTAADGGTREPGG